MYVERTIKIRIPIGGDDGPDFAAFYHFGGISAAHKRNIYGSVESNLADHIWHIIKRGPRVTI